MRRIPGDKPQPVRSRKAAWTLLKGRRVWNLPSPTLVLVSIQELGSRRGGHRGRGAGKLWRCQHFYFLHHKARLDTNNGTHWQPFRKTMRGKWATANPGLYANPPAEIQPADRTPVLSIPFPPISHFLLATYFPRSPHFFFFFFSGFTIWCRCPGDGPVSGWRARAPEEREAGTAAADCGTISAAPFASDGPYKHSSMCLQLSVLFKEKLQFAEASANVHFSRSR